MTILSHGAAMALVLLPSILPKNPAPETVMTLKLCSAGDREPLRIPPGRNGKRSPPDHSGECPQGCHATIGRKRNSPFDLGQ